MDDTTPLNKDRLLAEMDAVWRELDALLMQFSSLLDTRMPGRRSHVEDLRKWISA